MPENGHTDEFMANNRRLRETFSVGKTAMEIGQLPVLQLSRYAPAWHP